MTRKSILLQSLAYHLFACAARFKSPLFTFIVGCSLTASPALAQTNWIDPLGGSYFASNNWSPANVPNTSGETAQFNIPNTYAVTQLPGSTTTILDLNVLDGDVFFRNIGSIDATVGVTGDMLLNGGNLTLDRNGGSSDVNINVSNQLQITGGSELGVLETAQVITERLLVGDGTLGAGTLTINDGSVTATTFTKFSNGTLKFTGGIFEVNGGDGVFNSEFLYGGAEATAPEFRATNGADVAVDFTWQIGVAAGEFGSTLVSGVNGARRSTIRGTGGGAGADLVAGLNGTGSLTVLDGGLADLRDDFILGWGATGDGTVVVSGVNGAFRSTVEANNGGANSLIQIGRAGVGDLSISSGGLVTTSGDAFVGQLAGATGTLTIGGNSGGFDAALDVADDMGIGGSATSAGGTANVTINSGGLLQVDGMTKLWGLGTLTLDGGTVDANGGFDASVGTFDFRDGTLTLLFIHKF